MTYKGVSVRQSDFSAEILRTRKKPNAIQKVPKDKSCRPRKLYPAVLSFRHEGETRSQTNERQGAHHH